MVSPDLDDWEEDNDVASACCCCNDKTEEDDGRAETRVKNIMTVIPLTNMVLKTSAPFEVLVAFSSCNQKFIHLLDT